jgi:hypothetical protein
VGGTQYVSVTVELGGTLELTLCFAVSHWCMLHDMLVISIGWHVFPDILLSDGFLLNAFGTLFVVG